ncbi:histidine-containing phosphotransfer protein 5 [Sesamum angolense]|uniref:Histidine-containing phosphotransfer protein n=1 Tax=Sesamum angolense TaxID=2727404 RepID=A0AAE2BKM4_9LAMI|nr:histidine-containing phosphotransfer protein 5 [Sesamum angolense]
MVVSGSHTMEAHQLQHQAACMRKALFDQGYLDEQFLQLEDLEDEANPNFVEEVVKLYYTDSARFIRNIELTLCLRTFQEVKQEHAALKKKLESYFQLARQAR